MEEAENPLVSVIIITYNQEKYITQAVESVLCQQCNFPFEIVIGEDKSTDNTRQICIDLQKKYPDKIRLILNEKNKGVVNNYYDTLFSGKGKYIAECAGDDYWIDPFKLQKQVDTLEKNENIVLVHTNWEEIDESTGEIYNNKHVKKTYFKENLIGKEYTKILLNQKGGPFVYLCTACFRRDKVEYVYHKYPSLFDGNKFFCEDYQLIFLLLQEGSFYYSEDKTTAYRIRKESVSNSQCYKKRFDFSFSIARLRIEIIQLFDLDIKDVYPYLHLASTEMFSLAFKAKDPDLSKKAYQLFKQIDYKLSFQNRISYSVNVSPVTRKIIQPIYRGIRKIKRTIKQQHHSIFLT